MTTTRVLLASLVASYQLESSYLSSASASGRVRTGDTVTVVFRFPPVAAESSLRLRMFETYTNPRPDDVATMVTARHR